MPVHCSVFAYPYLTLVLYHRNILRPHMGVDNVWWIHRSSHILESISGNGGGQLRNRKKKEIMTIAIYEIVQELAI
jgi:hypothetical protein